MSIAVVFLARGIDGGLAAAEAFFRSYRLHPAGCSHRLVIIAKGWDAQSGNDTLRGWARELAAEVMELPDDGYDFGAYMRVAERLRDEWVCFINTHSRILHDNWLPIMSEAAARPGVGAAGCTGSWGTMATMVAFLPVIVREIWRNGGVLRGIKATGSTLLISPVRFALKAPSFPQYPNPHLRSNAFLTRTDLFADFARNRRIPRRKTDAHRLESGRIGFTRFLDSRGFTPVVVGADAGTFGASAWMESRTFRVPGQENLLISDNQTRAYDTAPRQERRFMELSAWGRFLTP